MSEDKYEQLTPYLDPKTGLEIKKTKIGKLEDKLKQHNIKKILLK